MVRVSHDDHGHDDDYDAAVVQVSHAKTSILALASSCFH